MCECKTSKCIVVLKLILQSEIACRRCKQKWGKQKSFSYRISSWLSLKCINFINFKRNGKRRAHPIFMELDWIVSFRVDRKKYDVQIVVIVTKTAQSNQKSREKSTHCAYESAHTYIYTSAKNHSKCKQLKFICEVFKIINCIWIVPSFFLLAISKWLACSSFSPPPTLHFSTRRLK